MEKHIPVLLNETIDLLQIKKDGVYLDLTLGRGGHSSEILKRLNGTGLLIGVDQDITAIEESEPRLSKINSNFKLIKSNFKDLDKVLEQLNIQGVDGILMDLGVSSPQFDDGKRGFSYNFDAKLDMRMDQSQDLSAEKIVNNYSLQDLTRIFKEYGEDKYSYQIAKEIVKEREKKPIESTFELVDIIKKSKPERELKKVGHPAKQVFQALRIEVNHELDFLKEALDKALKVLNHKGRLVVITFHSLEDRIVKNCFKRVAVIEGDRFDLPLISKTPDYTLINKKVIVANEKEINENRRSKSAKCRAIERN